MLETTGNTVMTIFTFLFLSLPFAMAQEPVATESSALSKAVTPAEQLAELEAQYDASELNYPERAEAFRADYENLASEFAGKDVGLRAELFLLSSCWWLEKPAQSEQAKKRIGAILKVYHASPILGEMADEVNFLLPKSERDAQLKIIEELSPHDQVKATVLLFRARGAQDEQRVQMFERLKNDYGKLEHNNTTFATVADAHLNPHARASLAVGEVAPEIVGVDLHGKEMKLSDFRGKVVVLDFWGDW